MIQQWPARSNLRSERARARSRRSLGCRRWVPEGLEDRVLPASPTVYTVDLISDSGAGSGNAGDLAYVINQANANHTNPAGSLIQFDPSVFRTPQIISLQSTLVLSETTGSEVIEGPGASLVTISGNNAVQVLQVASNVTATLAGVTISGGSATSDGGGINNKGTLTVTGSVINNNSVSGFTAGGGIANLGTMMVSNTTISNNSGNLGGGGIYNSGTLTLTGCSVASNTSAYEGGGIYDNGTLAVTDSLIENNSIIGSATGGGGGGIYSDGAAVTMTDSTIASNTVNISNGGGGGIDNQDSIMLTSSTVNGNSAQLGGGIYNNASMVVTDSTIAGNSSFAIGAGIDNAGNLTAISATIAYNIVGVNNVGGAIGGGGISVVSGSVSLFDTIVALNLNENLPFPTPFADDIYGTVSSASAYDLIGTGGSGGLTNGTLGNQVGIANPGLGPLTNKGGPTQTIALLPGSPAIDKGSNLLDGGLTTDQRGPGFVRVYNGTVDIGAYELQPALVVGASVSWGTQTDALQTAADGLRLLPAGRKTDLPWLNINELQLTFNQPVTLTPAEVTISSAVGLNYGPVAITGNGTSDTIMLARPIRKADRITITIGSATIATYTRRLDVLPGDFNDNGAVNKSDATAIRNEWKGKKGAMPTIFGDILGIGTVNNADYNAARKRIGTKLPKLSHKPPKAILDRSQARQHPGVKHITADGHAR